MSALAGKLDLVYAPEETPMNGTLHLPNRIALVVGVLHGLAGCGRDAQPLDGITEDLFAVNAVSEEFLIVGEREIILRSRDSGKSWSIESRRGQEDLYAVIGGRAGGVAVGGKGTILRKDNGAWRRVESGTSATLRAIWHGPSSFMGPSSIFVAGDDGVILRSMDDGATWELLQSGATVSFYAGVFAGRHYVAGVAGVILNSVDPLGNGWTLRPSATSEDFRSALWDFGYLLAGANGVVLSAEKHERPNGGDLVEHLPTDRTLVGLLSNSSGIRECRLDIFAIDSAGAVFKSPVCNRPWLQVAGPGSDSINSASGTEVAGFMVGNRGLLRRVDTSRR